MKTKKIFFALKLIFILLQQESLILEKQFKNCNFKNHILEQTYRNKSRHPANGQCISHLAQQSQHQLRTIKLTQLTPSGHTTPIGVAGKTLGQRDVAERATQHPPLLPEMECRAPGFGSKVLQAHEERTKRSKISLFFSPSLSLPLSNKRK